MSKQNLRELTVRSIEDIRDLSDSDILWLIERDRIPTNVKEELGAERLPYLYEENVPMELRGNTGDVRTISTEELEAELAKRRAEAEDNPNREVTGNASFDEPPLIASTKEVVELDDDDEDDESEESDDDEGDEDYEEGWDNDARRAELAKRGLVTEGKKDDMIARLLRSDNDELLDEDKAS